MKKDSVSCTICGCEIEIGTGMYNLPTGTECVKCHENPKKSKKEPKAMNIRNALDNWLEKNVMTKPQVKGLV